MPVVVEPPGRDGSDGIRQAHKPVLVQTLIPELPVKALHESVLHGFSGLDEPQLDAAAIGPLVEHAAPELGTVVEDERSGQSPPLHHSFQYPHHAGSRDRAADLNRDRLPREIIDDVQRPKGSSIRERVGGEVDRPPLIRPRRQRHRLARCRRYLLPLAPTHRERFLAVDPVHALAVDGPAFTAQQHVDAAVAVARPLARPGEDSLAQAPVVRPTRSILDRRAADRRKTAGSAATEPEGLLEEAHQASPALGLHHFFPSAAFSAWRSRDWSATRCLSRRFSSSSSRSFLASLTSSPLYFDFQRYSVPSLMPCSRHRSVTLRPAS